MNCKNNKGVIQSSLIGGFWLFVATIITSLVSYVFWFLLARIIGIESLGVASTVISTASISVNLISAGLNIAIMRETADRGSSVLWSSFLVTSLLGLTAGLVSIPLINLLSLSDLKVVAYIYAFLSVLGIFFQSTLIGFGKFKVLFYVLTSGGIVKFVVGVVLGFLGFGVLAPLVGVLVFPLVVSVLSGFLLLDKLKSAGNLSWGYVTRFLRLVYSNYPNMLSNQLLVMLGVYLFALIVDRPVSTGSLYISLMVVLATFALPNSVLSALLSVSTRSGGDGYSEGFRVSLGLTVPLLVLESGFAGFILWLIHPELASSAFLLRVLLAGVPPLVLVQAVVSRLNQFLGTGRIALIGVVRLAVLLGSLPVLVSWFGLLGAGGAFLAANIAGAVVALVFEPGFTRVFLVLWGVTVLGVFAPLATPWVDPVVSGVLWTLVSLVLMHVSRVYSVGELVGSLRLVLGSLKR